MNGAAIAVSFHSLCVPLLLSVLTASLKGTLILAGVYAATRLMRSSCPGLRHMLWLGAICGFLAILLLTLAGPPLLPMRSRSFAASETAYGRISALLRPTGAAPLYGAAQAPAAARGAEVGAALWWPLPLLLLWVAGAAASLIPVAAGGIQAHRLIASATESPWGAAALGELVQAPIPARAVRVVQGPAIRVPFASGVLHPVLALPSDAGSWSKARLRAVLLHELGHVRRADWFSQMFARCVCSLFWFVPPVWAAYWFLQVEQEKACDAAALAGGFAREQYASCLLHVAVHGLRPAAFAGLYGALRRRKMLESRIRHVASVRLALAPRWPALAIAGLVLSALILLGGARWKETLSDEQAFERFVGTWVNLAYPGAPGQSPVREIRAEYLGEDRPLPGGSTVVDARWTIKVKRTWMDEEGNTYCQFFYQDVEDPSQQRGSLLRLDRTGRVCESCARRTVMEDCAVYPARIDPKLYAYSVYYREK